MLVFMSLGRAPLPALERLAHYLRVAVPTNAEMPEAERRRRLTMRIGRWYETHEP